MSRSISGYHYICDRCTFLLQRHARLAGRDRRLASVSASSSTRPPRPPKERVLNSRTTQVTVLGHDLDRRRPSRARWTGDEALSPVNATRTTLAERPLDAFTSIQSPSINRRRQPSHQDAGSSSKATTAVTDKLSKESANSQTDRTYLSIPESELALRWDTVAPTPTQLEAADAFFTAQPAKMVWSAAKLREIKLPLAPRPPRSKRAPVADDTHHDDALAAVEDDDDDVGDSDYAEDDEPMSRPSPSRPPAQVLPTAPEVVFLGRSNVGKSTLLNAILGSKDLCHTSSKPGRTRTMNGISVNGGQLLVLDMPGYGKASREEWGKEIMKYLENRRALRRTFVLIDALHGLKATDKALLSFLRERAIPHQIVLSKIDRIIFPDSNSIGRSSRARLPSEIKTRANLERYRQVLRGIKDHVVDATDEDNDGSGSGSGNDDDRGRRSSRKYAPGPQALGEILGVSAENISPRVLAHDRRAKSKRSSEMAEMRLLLEEPECHVDADDIAENTAENTAQNTADDIADVRDPQRTKLSLSIRKVKLGVSALRWAVLCATGLDGLATSSFHGIVGTSKLVGPSRPIGASRLVDPSRLDGPGRFRPSSSQAASVDSHGPSRTTSRRAR